jgi:hypothetical protein
MLPISERLSEYEKDRMSESTYNRARKPARRRSLKLLSQKAHVVIFEAILIGAAIIEGLKFLWFLIHR